MTEPATAASIPYEGTDCTPEEAVEAVEAVRATAALREARIEYAVSCGGDVSEHHFGGRSVTLDYNAALDLLRIVAHRCKKGHHQVVSRTVEIGPWR